MSANWDIRLLNITVHQNTNVLNKSLPYAPTHLLHYLHTRATVYVHAPTVYAVGLLVGRPMCGGGGNPITPTGPLKVAVKGVAAERGSERLVCVLALSLFFEPMRECDHTTTKKIYGSAGTRTNASKPDRCSLESLLHLVRCFEKKSYP